MQYNFPLSLPEPADCIEEYTSDTGGFIGIDANPYAIHLVHCYIDGMMLDSLQAKPHQLPRVLNWIRLRKRHFPDLDLTGHQRDRWPPGLLPALVQEFGPICWVPENLLKKTLADFRRTDRLLKTFRAVLLANCAQEAQHFCEPDARTVVQRWKKVMLREMSFGLDDKPYDDIPF
jgi:hypothetical protein